jgi:hypothetical protein
MQHLRRLRYCSRGVRTFFTKHRLDYQKFLQSGIDEHELLLTGDAMAIAAINEAKNEQRK